MSIPGVHKMANYQFFDDFSVMKKILKSGYVGLFVYPTQLALGGGSTHSFGVLHIIPSLTEYEYMSSFNFFIQTIPNIHF